MASANEDIPAILKRHRLAAERSGWFDKWTIGKTDLPDTLGPFYVAPVRDERNGRTGLFNVCAVAAKGGEIILSPDFSDMFHAFRTMLAFYEAWLPTRPVDRVYFIGTELKVGKLVKVGFSRDPQSRLRALQTAHGERLQIFATVEGGKDVEEKYHRRWKARRRNGEWFTIGDCIIDEIDRINATAGKTPAGAA